MIARPLFCIPTSIARAVDLSYSTWKMRPASLTWGSNLWSAFDRMEQLEHTAKIYLNIALLGEGVSLTEQQVEAIRGLSEHYRTLAQPRTKEEPHD